MRRLLVLVLLLSGLVIFALAPSMLELGPLGTEHWYIAGWIASTFVAGLLSFRVAAHLETSACKAWRSFGLGCFCWTIAIVIWASYGWAEADLKFPGSADIFFIGSNVFFAAGMFYYFLADSPGNRIQVTNFALALCSTVAAGYILYFPVLLNSDVGWFGEIVAFSYPAIGLSTWAFALICNRLYVRGEDSFAFLLIMVGLGAIAIANSLYGLDVLNEAYFVGTVYDIGWIAGFAFVAWAALEQGRSGDIADRSGASPKPTALRDQALVPAISTAAVLLATVAHLWEEPDSGLAPLGILPFVVGLAACLAVREYSVVATERMLREEAESAASQLAIARERLTGVLASTTDGVMVLDPDWRVTFANKHAVATLFSDRTFLGISLWELHPEAVGGKIDMNYRLAMKHQTPVEFEIALSTGVWFEVHLYPTPDNLTVFFRDITERQQAKDELVHLAHHDPLTGLANRALFSERLALALESGRRQPDLVLVLIDLDDFKAVNDMRGHQAGDCLLQQFASRLAGLVRAEDTVARLGGDEFAIIQLEPVESEEGAGIARRISEALVASFEIEGSQLNLAVSIGIAMAPMHGTRPKELIRSADLALYRAKETKGTSLNYCIFDPGMDDHLQARLASRLGVQQMSAAGTQPAHKTN